MFLISRDFVSERCMNRRCWNRNIKVKDKGSLKQSCCISGLFKEPWLKMQSGCIEGFLFYRGVMEIDGFLL